MKTHSHAPAAPDVIAALRRLMALDDAVAEKRRRREPFAERLAGLEKRLVDLKRKISEGEVRLAGAQKIVRESELEMQTLAGRREHEAKKFDLVRTPKEAKAVEEEMKRLEAGAAVLEETTLERMIECDDLEAALKPLHEEASSAEKEREELARSLERLEGEVDELAQLQSVERERLLANLDPLYRRTYIALAASKRFYDPVVVVAGEECPSCSGVIRPAIIARLKSGDAATCDECGRIFLRVSPPSP